MSVYSSMRKLIGSKCRRPKLRRRNPVLSIEPLEDRLTPSTLTVNSLFGLGLAGDGLVTLGEAIAAANSDTTTDLGETGNGADTIVFDPALFANGPGTIQLVGPTDATFGPSGLLIDSDITIVGPTGDNGLTIDRDPFVNNLRLFRVTPGGVLTLENLTLQNGIARGGDGQDGANAAGGGGGAGLGGAIFNEGELHIISSTLVGNLAQGGDGGNGSNGRSNGGAGGGPNGGTGGSINAGDGGFGGGGGAAGISTFFIGSPGNGGFGGGGGGSASTFGGAAGFGGGAGGGFSSGFSGGGGGGAGLGGAIFNRGGTVTVTNSTLSSNRADGGTGGDGDEASRGEDGQGIGGGIFNHNGVVTLYNSTVTANEASDHTGGIASPTGSINLNSTIVAGNNVTPIPQRTVDFPSMESTTGLEIHQDELTIRAAPGAPRSIDFTELPTATLPSLSEGQLTITGSANLGVLNRGGLGVVGGQSNLAIDGGEHIEFTFAQPVTNISFTVNAFDDQDGDGDRGETLIEAFDANGLSLGTVTIFSPFTVNVSDLFGNQPISRFRLTAPSPDGIRLSSVSYRETQSFLRVGNRQGLGVVGGQSDLAADGGEGLDFTFTQPVTNVSFTVNAFDDEDGDGDRGETLIEAFDANGLSLGTVTLFSPFTVNVSDLFGNQPISRFRLTAPSRDGIRLASTSFTPVPDGVDLNTSSLTAENSLIGVNFGTDLPESRTPSPVGNLVGTFLDPLDPQLGALVDNGGPTPTHALVDGSPAIDAGANPLNLPFDGRGLARTQGAATDIGAFETPVSTNGTPTDPFARENEAFLDQDGNLVVVGMNDDTGLIGDVILVSAFDPANVRVTLNGQLLGPFNLGATGGRIIIAGLDGNDVIVSLGYISTEVYGGRGNDIIFGSYADDVLRGEEGDDVIFTNDGNDVAVGGAGADVIFGQGGADLIITGQTNRSYEELRQDRQNGSANGAAGLADLLNSVIDDDAVDAVFAGGGGDIVLLRQSGDGGLDMLLDEDSLDLTIDLAAV